MGWPFTSRAPMGTAQSMIAERTASRTGRVGRSPNREQSLRHSAVWACLRLRADLVSQMPVDVFRNVAGVQVEVPTPPVLQMPGGDACPIDEFLYSTQLDLDSLGNAFGLIKGRDGNGLPAMIELLAVTDVVVRMRGGKLTYRVGNETVQPADMWHEKQYTMSGLAVGLGPLAYAASSVGGYLSAQQFAQDWFGGSGMPAAILKNKTRKLNAGEATKVKTAFKASVTNGDVFTTGADWDYSMVAANAAQTQFLDERQYGLTDVCRFLGVPGDMIDAEPSNMGGGKITYANITQRNTQMLIMNLGGTISRRENAFSRRLVAQPRFVKLNPAALLRMDLKSRYDAWGVAIDKRFMAPSEARALDNRPPFTPDQIAEFEDLGLNKVQASNNLNGVPAA